jgi:hypothetical protein
MAICRSCGARKTWVIEYYRHPAPPALRSEDADSNDLLFAQSSINCPLFARATSCAINTYGPVLPATCNSLRTAKTFDTLLALIFTRLLSAWLSTTPFNVTFPFLTMM